MDDEYRLKPIPEPVKVPENDKKNGSLASGPGFTPVKEVSKAEQDNYTAVDYFNPEGWGEILLDPRLDVHGLKEKVTFIDKFTRKQIEDRGLILGKDAFSSILSEIEEMTQTGQTTKQEQRIGKIYSLLKIMTKQKSEKSRIKNILKSISKKFF